MNRTWMTMTLLAGALLVPAVGQARGLGVEVWTDRGSEAIYQPGDRMEIRTRATDDAYLLVYEIDSEGYVHVLFPYRGRNGMIEGRTTYRVPDEDADVELVVEKATGQGYIVAIASDEPFGDLPWYLRPYNPVAEEIGYAGEADDEEGITGEGRIVGDPFVQMERIRRRVLEDPNDRNSFSTAYTSYYVHEQVRYPRYICYDCHRPGRWQWWDDFDPYYTSCSTFDFRINWSWGWGPSYWFGNVPCYVYLPRPGCHPRYRYRNQYSSWDGWRRWNTLWSGHLVRYKTPPPRDYIPPGKYDEARFKEGRRPPPGILTSDVTRGRSGIRPTLPGGRGGEVREDGGTRVGDGVTRRGVPGEPGRDKPRDEGDRGGSEGRGRMIRPERQGSPDPRPNVDRPREERPAPREERPREERPAPRVEKPREEPRQEPQRHEKREEPRQEPQRQEKPREDRPKEDRPREDRPGRGWGESQDEGHGRSSKGR